MPETNKPAWVDALDEAKAALRAAASAGVTPEEANSKTRLAYAWMDVAKVYRDTDRHSQVRA